MRKETTLDDIAGKPEKVIFPKEHMEEFADKLKEKFGEFSRKGLHRFYSKANIAKIAWGIKKKDGSEEKFPYGKVVSVLQYPDMEGSKIWKGYSLVGNIPFTFWEDLYFQTCKYFSKNEFIEQKKLEGLEQLAESIGQQIHE